MLMSVKNIFFVVYAIVFIFGGRPALAAAPSCMSVYTGVDPMDFMAVSRKSYFQKIASALPNVPAALWKRYWNDPVTLEVHRRLFQRTKGESQRFEIQGQGDFITKTLVIEDHLFLDLVHIRAYQDGTGLKVGERAKGVNALFVKTMTAFLKTSVVIVQDNPGIKYIIIRGVNLKNPMLIEFLKENGFERNDLHSYSKEFEKTIIIDSRD